MSQPAQQPLSSQQVTVPAGSFKEAATPLDFIKANRKSLADFDPQVLSESAKAELEKQRAAPVEPVASDPKVETPPISEPPVEDADPISVQTSFKNLRETIKENKKTIEAKENELKEKIAELEKYRTGVIMPDVLQEKENKIQELSQYQKIHAFKTAPEYADKYVKPLTKAENSLKAIFKDYNLPEEKVSELLEKTNLADINHFISDHFDRTGGNQVSDILDSVRGLKAAAREAEKEPLKALESLQEEHRKINEIRKGELRSKISDTAKNAWIDTLTSIKQENRVPELILKEGDEAHNEHVRPIIAQAATEYGKMIATLVEHGLETLPKELATAFGKAALYSLVSGVSVESRNRAIAEAEELRKNTQRDTKYERPPIGGSFGSPGGAPASKPATIEQRVDGLLNTVLSKR